MAGDYIPRPNKDFTEWFRNLNYYVALKTTGAVPDWLHIPKEVKENLKEVYADWYIRYVIALQPCTGDQKAERNHARKTAEKIIRPFVKQYLHFPQVTDGDRSNIGIR